MGEMLCIAIATTSVIDGKFNYKRLKNNALTNFSLKNIPAYKGAIRGG